MTKLSFCAIIFVSFMSGCMNLTTRLQADDLTVKDSNEGQDCVPIILGIGIGTATVEDAMVKGRNREQVVQAQRSQNYVPVPTEPIQKIRRVEFSDYWFMGFGARCIEVTGEGAVKISGS